MISYTYVYDKPRNSGGSHFIYKTPWQSNPRIIFKKVAIKQKRIR